MSTKQGYDQHNVLHHYFPHDCCLCRTELEIQSLKIELQKAKKEIEEYKNVAKKLDNLQERQRKEIQDLKRG